MYTRFFQLTQAPFSIAPDPHYLFMSERHREALAHLLYGVSSGGGFVLLTGEIGAGKTTVCRCFLQQIPPGCNVAYIFNPKLTVAELLHAICDEFGVTVEPSGDSSPAPSMKDRIDALNRFLLVAHAQGGNNILIIDEAQNLSAEVLEQLRLLTNLETNERKLLQIMLIGQPELQELLARPELEQLAQRVIARYHLGPLSEEDAGHYIQHRLRVAGLETASPFLPPTVRLVHKLSGGVPRRINLLCDRALLGAYTQDSKTVDLQTLQRAADEVFGKRGSYPRAKRRWQPAAWGVAAASVLVLAAWTMVPEGSRPFAASKAIAKPGAERSDMPPTLAKVATAPADKSDEAPSVTVSDKAIASEDDGKPSSAEGISRDREQIYRQLASMWDVQLQKDEQVCQAASKQDVRCYQGDQGLAELRQLERPAVLTLLDGSSKPYFVLLRGLTNASATIVIGGHEHTLSLLELGRRFPGEFMTLWRTRAGQRPSLRLGEEGDDVIWLAQQLGRMTGNAALARQTRYDAKLASAVREFQKAQGLVADGIAGPKTLMHLNSATGMQEPRLNTSGPAVASQEGE